MKAKNKSLTLFLISLSIISIYLILTAPLNKEIIQTSFVAGQNPGFDLTPGNLNFGKIVPGGSATRKITITNNYNMPTITKVKSSGATSKYIIVSENNFILQPFESINLTFTVYPTKNIELKEYMGTITIITRKN